MITWRKYQAGDIDAVGMQEPEPFDGWADFVEEHGRALATVLLDGQPLAVIGCTMCWDGVADCVAVVDRSRAAGHGKILAEMARARIHQAMPVLGIHRMQCTAAAQDKAGHVFLRAIGFRKESIMRQGAPDKTDLVTYAILGAPGHDQQA